MPPELLALVEDALDDALEYKWAARLPYAHGRKTRWHDATQTHTTLDTQQRKRHLFQQQILKVGFLQTRRRINSERRKLHKEPTATGDERTDTVSTHETAQQPRDRQTSSFNCRAVSDSTGGGGDADPLEMSSLFCTLPELL